MQNTLKDSGTPLASCPIALCKSQLVYAVLSDDLTAFPRRSSRSDIAHLLATMHLSRHVHH